MQRGAPHNIAGIAGLVLLTLGLGLIAGCMAGPGLDAPDSDSSSEAAGGRQSNEGEESVVPEGPSQFPFYSDMLPDKEYANYLKDKALELARSEFNKFRKASGMYKNEVRLHKNMGHPFTPNEGVLIKSYLDYRAFRVTDVVRTESFLEPVEFIIEYTYEFMHTPPHYSEQQNRSEGYFPADNAVTETEFTEGGLFSFTRKYRSDRYGNNQSRLYPGPDHQFYVGTLEVEGLAPPAFGGGKDDRELKYYEPYRAFGLVEHSPDFEPAQAKQQGSAP